MSTFTTVRPHAAEEAEQGSRGTDADGERREEGAQGRCEEAAEDVDRHERVGAVKLLQVATQLHDDGAVDHEVDDAGVEPHAHEEPPPLALVRDLKVVDGSHVQERVHVRAKEGIALEGVELPPVRANLVHHGDRRSQQNQIRDVHPPPRRRILSVAVLAGEAEPRRVVLAEHLLGQRRAGQDVLAQVIVPHVEALKAPIRRRLRPGGLLLHRGLHRDREVKAGVSSHGKARRNMAKRGATEQVHFLPLGRTGASPLPFVASAFSRRFPTRRDAQRASEVRGWGPGAHLSTAPR
eukprot:scaffold1806_cov240-Pinguiococcus_pyrenoidosus.AAC.2